MDKTAAEKIAHEYYNAGIEVALQQAGLVKEANRTLSALLGGTALAPAALSHIGHGGGAYGEALLNALKSVNPTHSFDPSKLKAIGSGLAGDAGQLKQFLMGLGG
jgi:hypothetical protein